MMLFETGLSQYFTESKATYHVRIAMLFYNFALESMPESLEGLNKFLKDQSQNDWNSLSCADLMSAFQLLFFSYLICITIIVLEIICNFIIGNYFALLMIKLNDNLFSRMYI
jgi:hypothetical protein